MPRFVLDEVRGSEGFVRGQEARHLLNSHRARIGDSLEVTHGNVAFRAVLAGVADGEARVILCGSLPDREPAHKVILGLAVIRPERLEVAIQKAVELGVHSIRLIVSAHSASAADRISAKIDRFNRIALEAAKQCGRTRVPPVLPPQPFRDALESSNTGVRLVAHEKSGLSLTEALGSSRGSEWITLLVGPEGGFTEAEIAQAKDRGFTAVGLGPRILRAETAAVALLAITMHELGELE